MDRLIGRLDAKRQRTIDALYAAGGAARDVVPDIEARFRDDVRTRTLVRDDLRRAIANAAHFEAIYPVGGADRLLARSSAALRLAASGGLLPANVGAAHAALIEAAGHYDQRLSRVLAAR